MHKLRHVSVIDHVHPMPRCTPPIRPSVLSLSFLLSLKWITRGLPANGKPLPLGELVQIRRAAEACAIAGLAHAAHWDAGMIVDGLIVHVNHSGLQLACNPEPALH